MVSPSHKSNGEKSGPQRTESSAEIILLELRSCLDTLEVKCQDDDKSNDSLSNYKWLADNRFHRPSKQILDNMTVAELTELCNKLCERDVMPALRELQNLAHISSTANQLIGQFKLYLADTITGHELPVEPCVHGSPPVRRMSMSGMLAGIKNLRRKNSPCPTPAIKAKEEMDSCSVETQQTTV